MKWHKKFSTGSWLGVLICLLTILGSKGVYVFCRSRDLFIADRKSKLYNLFCLTLVVGSLDLYAVHGHLLGFAILVRILNKTLCVRTTRKNGVQEYIQSMPL